MFYTYRQNNSGGSFNQNERVGQYVIIEAENANKANDYAVDKVGIYFDGCDGGLDCSCCGDRWYPCYEDDGDQEPKIYGKTIEEFKKDPGFALEKEISIHIYYINGDHEKVIFDAERARKNKEKIDREQSNKLWGNFFSLSYGIRNEQPIRFFEHKFYNAVSSFYDKTGNLSIEEGLSVGMFNVISFSSKSKKEVEEFMAGAQEVLDIAKSAVTELKPGDDVKGRGMKAAIELFTKKS
jgi:hypothetical protein